MVIAMLLFMAVSVEAQVIVTTADGDGADTYCPNDNQSGGSQGPDSNLGSETRIRAFRQLTDTRSKTGYIRFDISNVAGDLTEAIMTFASTYQKGGTKTVTVYGVNDGPGDFWDESTITYNTAAGLIPNPPTTLGNAVVDPDESEELGTLATPGAEDPGEFSTDISLLNLDSFLAKDTNGLVTFFFQGDDNENEIASKERTDGLIPPTLTLPNATLAARANTPAPPTYDTVTTGLAQLSWANPEPNDIGGVITCDVYLGTTEPNTAVPHYGLPLLESGVADVSGTSSITAPTLEEFTTYYWVVEINDTTSPGVKSGLVWVFDTNNSAPAVDAGVDQFVWLEKAVITAGSDADTYMREDGTARGGEGHMDIHGSAGRTGYVRFDLSGLTAMGPGLVQNASLTFTKTSGGARDDTIVSGRVGLKGLDDVLDNTPQNWGEATLSTSNVGLEHPGSADYDTSKVTDLDMENGAAITETIVDGGSLGGTITITGADLEAFLQGRVEDNGLVTFIVSFPGTSGRGYALATKDNTAGHAEPLLTLTYVPDSAPNGGDAQVDLSGIVSDDGLPSGTLDLLWSQVSGPETVTIDPGNVEEVTVFISTAGTYEFQLEADDSNLTGSDIVQVYVGTTPCDAAQAMPEYQQITGDFDNNCIVDLGDLAELAIHWLECNSLACP